MEQLESSIELIKKDVSSSSSFDVGNSTSSNDIDSLKSADMLEEKNALEDIC